MSETTLERDTLASRAAAFEADLFQRDGALREADLAKTALLERATALAKAYNSKEAEVARNLDTTKALTDRVAFLEEQVRTARDSVEREIEDLNEARRREKVERAVVEGALEAARKDFGRLMREVMTLEQQGSHAIHYRSYDQLTQLNRRFHTIKKSPGFARRFRFRPLQGASLMRHRH